MFQCYSYCAGEFGARITKHWMSTQEVRSKHKNFRQVVSCCASSSPKWGKFTSLLYFLPRTAFILILAYCLLQPHQLSTVELILSYVTKFSHKKKSFKRMWYCKNAERVKNFKFQDNLIFWSFCLDSVRLILFCLIINYLTKSLTTETSF